MKRPILYCILITFALQPFMSASADKLTDRLNNVNGNIKKVQKAQQEQKKKKQQADTLKKQLAENEKKQDLAYKNAMAQIDALKSQVVTMEDALKDAEDDFKSQEDLYKTRLRVMYETSDETYLQILMESKNIIDFFDRMEIISTISRNNKSTLDELRTVKNDISFKKAAVDREKSDADKKATKIHVALNDIKSSRAGLERQLDDINKRLYELEEQEDSLQKTSDDLIGQIKARERKGVKYSGGSMVWPCPSSGHISSPFGYRLHPVLKTYKMHTGIDISASSGVSIIAANKGTVIYAGWQNGYGNTVIIDHGGGISTLYGHASRLLVSEGSTVNAGDVIAKVGSTGLSTGPHLHFEVRKSGVPVDPTSYVSP